MIRCCFCGKDVGRWGNNPWPLNENPDARCCDKCNDELVVPARIGMELSRTENTDKEN